MSRGERERRGGEEEEEEQEKEKRRGEGGAGGAESRTQLTNMGKIVANEDGQSSGGTR